MNPSRLSLSPSTTCRPQSQSQAASRGPERCSCKQQHPPTGGWAGRRGISHLLFAHLLWGQGIYHCWSFAPFPFFFDFLFWCLRKERKTHEVCMWLRCQEETAAQRPRISPGHEAYLLSWWEQD